MNNIKNIMALMIMFFKLSSLFSQSQNVNEEKLRKIRYSIKVVSTYNPFFVETLMFCYQNKVLSEESIDKKGINQKKEFIGYQLDKNIGLHFSAEKSHKLAIENSPSFEQWLFLDITDLNLSSTQKRGDELVEMYRPIQNKCTSSADTIYVYYKESLKGVCFSFAEELEKIKKNKISKIELIFSTKRMIFEITEIPITENKQKIIPFFKRLDNFYLSQK